MYFTGVSEYKKTQKDAKNEAIDEAVKTFLNYLDIKEEANINAFKSEFTPQLIKLRKGESGIYNIMMDDFYWEKYVLEKRKIRLYKGYILLKWPTQSWVEFRRYVRQSSKQRVFPKQ